MWQGKISLKDLLAEAEKVLTNDKENVDILKKLLIKPSKKSKNLQFQWFGTASR